MYCEQCGVEASDGANYCPNCGDGLADPQKLDVGKSPGDGLKQAVRPIEADEWDPQFPIPSVFASIMLLWAATWTLAYSGGSPVAEAAIWAGHAVLIIPRVRRRVVTVVREKYDRDLTGRDAKVGVAVWYGTLTAIAAVLMGGSAARDPTVTPGESIGVWVLMLLIAFGFAVAIVWGIRLNRRL